MTIRQREIEVEKDGTTYGGLLVHDDASALPLPGVLVAPTVRGRSSFEEQKARALAGLGYAALVIDVYGIDTRDSDIETFRALMNALLVDRSSLSDRLLAWVDCCRGQAEVDAGRIAAIGFCFGGLCVLDIARGVAGVSGVVSFHGIFEPPPASIDAPITARVLALHGWDDPLAQPESVHALASELTRRAADWQIHAYGNTLHAFTNPAANDRSAGTVYDARADRRSWIAMREFLAELFAD